MSQIKTYIKETMTWGGKKIKNIKIGHKNMYVTLPLPILQQGSLTEIWSSCPWLVDDLI